MKSFSYSAYSAALVCLQKYKLCYIDKIVPEGGENGDLKFGSALHCAINGFLEGVDGSEIFDIYWKAEQNKGLEYGRYHWEALHNIGHELLRKFKETHLKHFVPQVMEKRLYATYKGLALEGTMDFLGTYKGVLSLVDWKTTGYNYAPEKIDVALQLNLYAYLCQQSLGVTPEQIVYYPFVKSTGGIQRPLIMPYSQDTVNNMLDNMVDYVAKLEHNNTYPKNYNSCIIGARKCEYYSRCFPKGENK